MKERNDTVQEEKKKCDQQIAYSEITSKNKLENLLRQEQTISMSLRADIAKERLEIARRISGEVKNSKKKVI